MATTKVTPMRTSEERVSQQVQPGGIEQSEEGEVPEIGAIGDLADVAEDRVAERQGQRAHLGGDGREDDGGHPEGEQEVATLEEERARAGQLRPQIDSYRPVPTIRGSGGRGGWSDR